MQSGKLLSITFIAFALAHGIRAQTFVVDANNGPGTHFTEIAAAIASVPSNATLIVRAGSYAPFVLAAKGMTLLADANVVVTGSSVVRDTLPGQPVTLSGLELRITPGEATVLLLENCADRVLLNDLTTPANLPPVPVISVFYGLPLGLFALGCTQLCIRDCTLTSTALRACSATFESCQLRGGDTALSPWPPTPSHPGLQAAGSSVELSGNCVLTGGDGLSGFSNAVGIRVISSIVRMRSGTVSSGNGIGATPFPPSLIVSGQLLVDPSVTLVGTSSPPGTQPQVTPLSELISTNATAPGATITATASSPNSTLVALFAGLPMAPAQLLTLPVATWLDPTHAVLEAIGIAQPGSDITGTLAVPNQPSLRGAAVAWQALTLSGATLANTNPALAIVL